jgi:hypothetical protein
MRIPKLIIFSGLAVSILTVAGFLYYEEVISPKMWYPWTRNDSIRILTAAQTKNDLKQVLSWGAFIPLTNGSWIAIRYRDSHLGGIFSCAVARDSGGGWFESDRHFCGSLSGFWSELKIREGMTKEEMLAADIRPLTNLVYLGRSDYSHVPTIDELEPIALAPDLESARRELVRVGFRVMPR